MLPLVDSVDNNKLYIYVVYIIVRYCVVIA